MIQSNVRYSSAMILKLYKIVLLSLGILLLQSCVAIWPAYSRIEPKTAFTIIDENRAPIANAQVVLNRRADGVHERTQFGIKNKLSDQNGQVSFNGKRQWEIQILALHSPIGYDWSWCVHKPGYQSHYIQKDSRTLTGKCSRGSSCPGEAVTITLKAGSSTACEQSSVVF